LHFIIHEKKDIGKHFMKTVVETGKFDQLKNASAVVIKPNFAGSKNWDNNSITAMPLLKEVVTQVLVNNDSAKVYIAESDSIYGRHAERKFKLLGLPESLGLELMGSGRVGILNITRDRRVQIKNDGFLFFSKRNGFPILSKTVTEADFTISLANVKTHNLCLYTGACKNLFGCLAKSDKNIYHGNIHKVIHDVNLVVKPDISILDGFRGMQGNGPTDGEPVDFGFMIFSDYAAEADFAAMHMVGLNPMKIKYLKLISRHFDPSFFKFAPGGKLQIKKPDLKIRVRMFFKRLLVIIGYKLIRRGI
jgi:uncharacterized protein (DUF362 family)